jgi:hypothetical protein
MLAGLVAVLAVGLGAAPSLAAASMTWTVRPGGAFSAASSGPVKFKDTKTGSEIDCRSVTMSGALRSGRGLDSRLGRISAVTIPNCGNFIVFHVTAGDLPWPVLASAYDPALGTTTGTFSGVHIGWAGPGCTAAIDGTSATANDGVAGFSYTNGTRTMKLLASGGNLHFRYVHGCAGLIVTGDRATITGTFTVTPPQQITSP